MSRNGSGIYNLPTGNPVVTGTTITSNWANTTLSDISTALTGSVASDGQTPITGDLQLGGNKITGLGTPTATTDGTTKAYVDAAIATASSSLGTMSTQNANNVAITGGTITGLSSALPVASGGTGATTSTGSGANVLGTSPTISSPTISSGSITFSDSSTQASSVSVLGIGGSAQTWQALIGSRNSGTSYTNSTGKPIMVVFNNQSSGTSTYTIVVQGITIVNTNAIGNTATYTFIVPIGASYSITWTNGGSNLTWSELR
jgi:hypothetical protein